MTGSKRPNRGILLVQSASQSPLFQFHTCFSTLDVPRDIISAARSADIKDILRDSLNRSIREAMGTHPDAA